jgi:hypothetical protein
MNFKIGQKVVWSEGGIDYFARAGSSRAQLRKAIGEIKDIDDKYIHVFWDFLDDTVKAEAWAINLKPSN